MSLQDMIEETRRQRRARLDEFALKAPPAPDWYMQPIAVVEYPEWCETDEGRLIIAGIKSSERIPGDPAHEYDIQKRIHGAIRVAYDEWRTKAIELFAQTQQRRIFTWPAYYASEVLKAIDEVHEAQYAQLTPEGSPGNALDPEELRRKDEAFERMKAANRGLSWAIDDRSEEEFPDLDSSCGV